MIRNLTGGVLYHYLALKHRNHLWNPFKSSLSRFINGLSTDSNKLVLIGPSGGYCLPQKFITKLNKIEAFDPDLLAKIIFNSRHSPINIKWHSRDCLVNDQSSNFQILNQFKPSHIILLSNIYGQMRCLFKSERLYNSWKVNFLNLIKGFEFISYHDIYSFKSTFKLNSTLNKTYNSFDLLKNDLVLYSKTQKIEFVDHLTHDDFDFVKKKVYFLWELHPNNYHIIEAVYYNGRRPQ